MKRTNPMIFVVAALVVVAVAAGAYLLLSDDDGADDDSTDDDGLRREYVDAIASGWPSDPEDETGLFADVSDDDIQCMAGVTVEVAGVDRIAEHYTPDELREQIEADPSFELDLGDDSITRDQAEQMVDGLDRCLGFLERLRDQMRTAAAGNQAVTSEAVDCMTEALDDDFLRGVTVDDFMSAPGADISTAVAQRVEDQCGDLLPAD